MIAHPATMNSADVVDATKTLPETSPTALAIPADAEEVDRAKFQIPANPFEHQVGLLYRPL